MKFAMLAEATLLAVWVAGSACAAPRAHARADILYSFTGGPDGGGSFGSLVLDTKGNLYGTTGAGGIASCGSPLDAPGCGVVFELSPPASGHGAWTRTVLYTFQGGTDGDGPLAGLTRDANGNLFGTTEAGGSSPNGCVNGCGTAFELSPPATGSGPWTETVLHRFGAASGDGTFPAGQLVQDAQGNLYGTTPSGGANDLGTIFELSQQNGVWTETILHDFGPADGSGPLAGLLLTADGTLFGTAESGSRGGKICRDLNDCGTVFQLSPPAKGQTDWAFSVLFRFPGNGRDGLYPLASLIQDKQGQLFGTADNFGLNGGRQANGTVFRLSPPKAGGENWRLETLLAFDGMGAYPAAPVLQGSGGTLFGTTVQGAKGRQGNGLVYALSPPVKGGTGAWTETPLFYFPQLADGGMPMAGLIADAAGRLYGTTSIGGASCNSDFCGTVYRVTIPK